jgi:hypothetical protein
MHNWPSKCKTQWNRVRHALTDLYPYIREYLPADATQLDFAKWVETKTLGVDWERNDFDDEGRWTSVALVLEAARARKVADALEALLSHYQDANS